MNNPVVTKEEFLDKFSNSSAKRMGGIVYDVYVARLRSEFDIELKNNLTLTEDDLGKIVLVLNRQVEQLCNVVEYLAEFWRNSIMRDQKLTEDSFIEMFDKLSYDDLAFYLVNSAFAFILGLISSVEELNNLVYKLNGAVVAYRQRDEQLAAEEEKRMEFNSLMNTLEDENTGNGDDSMFFAGQ